MKRLSQLIAFGVIAAAAAFVVLFAVKPVEAKADGHANHCICGGNGTCIETATTANGHTQDVPTEWQEAGDFTTFKSLISGTALNGHVYIYLSADITATGLVEAYTRNVHLCLNGHFLKTAKDNRVFYFGKSSSGTTGATLTICDCQGGGFITKNDETSTGKAGQGGLMYFLSGSTLVLYSGTIKDGITSGSNPGGNLSFRTASVFKMYGGTVTGGHAGANGGNIEVDSSSFYMYGGTISSGTSTTYGGNILLTTSNGGGTTTAEMYGGTITLGTATTYGGNVALYGSTTLTINGGTISEGTAGSYGGNGYVQANSTLNLYGGKILGGTANGGSSGTFYLGGKFTMTGGEVTGGTATGNGGIANVDGSKAVFTITGGTLRGGKAGSGKSGNMLYVSETAKLSIGGTAKVIGTENDKYNIYSASKYFTISGTPTLYMDTTASPKRLIQVAGTTATLTVEGGTFGGNILTDKGATTTINDCISTQAVYAQKNNTDIGNVTINGGFFASANIKPTDSASGKMTINGGYFAAAPALDNENLSFGADVWKNAGNPAIPFVYEKAYELGEGASTFTTNYAISTCKQITGRNMILNESLALGLYANVDLSEPLYKNGNAVGKISVTLNGETKEADLSDLPEVTWDALPNRMFVFEGVTPELMGDEIAVTLYTSDGTSVIETKTYTIKEYLEAMKAKTAADLGISDAKKAALDTLADDLLVYGGAAQTKFNHNTENLVSDGVTGSGREPSGNIADIWNKTTVTAANHNDATEVPGYFKEATVIHENINWIRVKYIDNAADDGTTFTAMTDGGTETAVTLDNGYLCTDGLKASEYGTRFIFRAYRGSEVISKVEYSMNSYCVRKHTDPGHEFSDALYNYGASAAAFATAE